MGLYTFDDVANIVVGQVFYECESGRNIVAMCLTKAEIVAADDGKRSARFKGLNLMSHEEINYMVTEGLMHYGPRLYTNPEYVKVAGPGEIEISYMGERPKKTISFNYRNHRGKVENRTIDVDRVEWLARPGYDYQPGWFISGYCHDRKARRSFALTHIVLAYPTVNACLLKP